MPRWAWWLAAALACVWFGTLDLRHLLRSDEGRYAEIAREMFVSGDWVTIRYHGLKYFEKPPLHLWMTTLAYHAFGVGEWQARLWAAVSGAMGIGLTALAAHRWWGPRVALYAALALVASPSWNVGSHFNSLDIGVAAALAGVLAALLIAQHPGASAAARRNWMLGAWAAMALAVLTKGLIGVVLPALALLAYTGLTRDTALWRRLHPVPGLAVFAAIAVPWFVAVSARNPEFARFFFIHEHFERYTSSVHQRGAAWWYFGPQLLFGALPWLGLVPHMVAGVRQGWRGEGPGPAAETVIAEDHAGASAAPAGHAPEAAGAARPAVAKAAAPDGSVAAASALRPRVLLAAWAGAIFVFFSLSGSKLPGYILPVLPALALLAALAFDGLDARGRRRQCLGWMVLALLAFVATAWVGPSAPPGDAGEPMRRYGVWLAAAALLLAAGCGVALRLNGAGHARGAVAAFAASFFAATTVGLVGHETLGRPASGAGLVPRIEAMLRPGMPIYAVRLLDHTLPFYLRRTTVMVEAPDELAFGVAQEPARWLPTLAAFRTAWTTGPHALALMSPQTYDALRAQGLPMEPLARDARRVVVANFRQAVR